MNVQQPPEHLQLERFVAYPREDIDVEYKGWLDLTVEKERATLAKAAIALANHGGGHIILGFREEPALQSVARPPTVPEITQDGVNAAIRQYAEPEFHCQVYNISHPHSGVSHPVIGIPGSAEPVMCRRDQLEAGVSQHRFYIRKPGPRSEEPRTAEEWRSLLDRCIRARREDMLDSIRSIVLGRADDPDSPPEPLEALRDYCAAAYERWAELASDLPVESPPRFPNGCYEMGFALVGAPPVADLAELQDRLGAARRIKLSGWTPFLEMQVGGWEPYPFDDFIEAWTGRPIADGSYSPSEYCDFWRASLDNMLYTIRGHLEDGEWARGKGYDPGTALDFNSPIMAIAEGILFANRFAEGFEGVEQIAVRCRFTGLNGRSLARISTLYGIVAREHISRTDEVVLTSQVTLQQAQDNLPEVVHGLLRPLFEKFGFYGLNLDQVQSSLRQMRRYG